MDGFHPSHIPQNHGQCNGPVPATGLRAHAWCCEPSTSGKVPSPPPRGCCASQGGTRPRPGTSGRSPTPVRLGRGVSAVRGARVLALPCLRDAPARIRPSTVSLVRDRATGGLLLQGSPMPVLLGPPGCRHRRGPRGPGPARGPLPAVGTHATLGDAVSPGHRQGVPVPDPAN